MRSENDETYRDWKSVVDTSRQPFQRPPIMQKLLLLFGFVASVTCQAQNITTVRTLVIAGTVTNSVGGRDWNTTQTNSVVILNGQAARVATIRPSSKDGLSDFVWFEKNGVTAPGAIGDVIAGPAVFYLRNEPPGDALLTLELWAVKKSRL